MKGKKLIKTLADIREELEARGQAEATALSELLEDLQGIIEVDPELNEDFVYSVLEALVLEAQEARLAITRALRKGAKTE